MCFCFIRSVKSLLCRVEDKVTHSLGLLERPCLSLLALIFIVLGCFSSRLEKKGAEKVTWLLHSIKWEVEALTYLRCLLSLSSLLLDLCSNSLVVDYRNLGVIRLSSRSLGKVFILYFLWGIWKISLEVQGLKKSLGRPRWLTFIFWRDLSLGFTSLGGEGVCWPLRLTKRS